MTNKQRIYLIVATIAWVVMLTLLITNSLFSQPYISETKEEEDVPVERPFVLTTVAHIKQDTFDGYTLVYADEENDRAVYVLNGEPPKPDINVGDEVYFNGLACTITNIDEQGFSIELPSGMLATKGMSGSPVYKDCLMLGVVSRALSLTEIYIIYC